MNNTVKIWNGKVRGEVVSAYLTGLTEPCKNKKLGRNVLQLSVLADRLHPGLYDTSCNEATCRGCQLRPDHSRLCPICGASNAPHKQVCCECKHILPICYVNRAYALGRMYMSNRNKSVLSLSLLKDLVKNSMQEGVSTLRLGMFGNVTAIDEKFLMKFLEFVDPLMPTTGYVSDWIYLRKNHPLQDFCMASVGMAQNPSTVAHARDLGWSTFRIRLPNGRVDKDEKLCDHEVYGTKCMNCLRCDGRGDNCVVTLHR